MSGAGKDEFDVNPEDLKKFWGDADAAGATTAKPNGGGDGSEWADPDMGMLRQHRRPPPALPIDVFGPQWKDWIHTAADAAACPPDYTAIPLLSAVSTLIGHARWPRAWAGWEEPPHLWGVSVGDSGSSKSPGADCLLGQVLPELEHRMNLDFPDRRREWQATVDLGKASIEEWQEVVRAARKKGNPRPPRPQPPDPGPEPQAPRLRQNDITVEKVATVLATTAPKGLLIVRDEIAGWIASMSTYNAGGRSFWVESFGGRQYRVERVKHPDPIIVPRLAVSVYGNTQPDKLAVLMDEPDDGLLSRILWTWPEPVEFRKGKRAPGAEWAISALDRLRELDMQPGDRPSPIYVPLADRAQPLLEEFGRQMQQLQMGAGGLLRSAFGKARGQVLRLSLSLGFLHWCGRDSMEPPPAEIGELAFAAAATLMADYFMPMAERTYGDAGATETERTAATLARWIIREHPPEVHVRQLQRDVRLPGLRTAEQIKAAAGALVEADWLHAPPKGFGAKSKVSYAINPKIQGFSA